MTKVLILGNNGMLGHAMERIFRAEESIDVQTTSRSGARASWPFDVLKDDIGQIIKVESPDYVINCIGTIKPRIDENSMYSIQKALSINSLFPHQLFQVTKNSEVKIIQIATDCVFSGSKGSYAESDRHDPTDVYGKTKSLGEICSDNFLNLRVSIIGPERERSTSLLEWFLNQPPKAKVHGYANHYWNGVSTFHFAKVVLGIVESPTFLPGKAHLVPRDKINKFELLQAFKETYSRIDIEIEEMLPDLVIDRTLITENSKQNIMLWENAGYKNIPGIREIVAEMKNFSNRLP
jgi:dTDP-4-dehydrorhamnose reductase